MAEVNSPLLWRRSRRCDTKDCVEVAVDPRRDRVYLRNSRDPQVRLELSAEAWRTFCAAAAAGELDQPAAAAG
jgi:hypothetical protein